MIIILKSGVGDAEIEVVCSRITEMGYHPHIIRGEFKTVVAAVGEERGRPDLRLLEALETVESVMPVQQPFKLASKEVRAEPSEVRVNGVVVGGNAVVRDGGPVLRGVGIPDARGRRGRQGRRRENPARRCLQAADVAVRLPGTQGTGPSLPGGGTQADRLRLSCARG